MIILERRPTPGRTYPTLRVRCEGCGEVYFVTGWAHGIRPERRCNECSRKLLPRGFCRPEKRWGSSKTESSLHAKPCPGPSASQA